MNQHKSNIDPTLLEDRKSVPDYLPGYAEVAAFVSMDRDGGLYHRLRTLSARNILYMQCELASIAAKLDSLDMMDSAELRNRTHIDVSKQCEISMCATEWDVFKDVSWKKNGNAKERMDVLRELRPLLRNYYEAIALDHQIANISEPSKSYPQTYKTFVQAKESEINMPGIHLGAKMPVDYVLTYAQPDSDRLSSAVQNFVTKHMHFLEVRRDIPKSWRGLYFYSDTLIERIVSVLSIVLATALLVCSIVALDYVHGKKSRLGILAAFTVAFAAIVGLLTNAKRTEMFGATAAFVAVLVVYVSGTLGDGRLACGVT